LKENKRDGRFLAKPLQPMTNSPKNLNSARASMLIQEIIDFVFEIAPNPSFGSENIYEFGDGAREVTGIGVAWWITSDILEKLAAEGFQLGLSHERVVYDMSSDYVWGKNVKTDEVEVNRRFKKIIEKHQISIHRFHSNIDLVEWGMPHAFFDQLGWGSYPIDWSRGVPVVEIPPIRLEELLHQVKLKLKLPFLRYDGDLNKVIRRVAVPLRARWRSKCPRLQ
jgi:putative NIF3 family GTP cyclohydrolase 1 type 2